jgi:hypothetical protein
MKNNLFKTTFFLTNHYLQMQKVTKEEFEALKHRWQNMEKVTSLS